ncbi:phosphotransferase [Ornithinibacillus sp. L9]|uniref:Phosphotransferase n=1 Tax=Ornithinibacillus caprae TaxID=2678566 RepID=A0A6N8FGU8_9BACI|nr:aminoglycoside phosphotransferase family protein [Ornithinibacillus caprae]MUK88882.1 phosphotransferase [Ornithinibacillus caprae]
MDIEKVVMKLIGDQVKEYTKIEGGLDSLVWKITSVEEHTYALRVLPKHRYHQFVQEQSTLKLAGRAGVPVPKVHKVDCYDQYTVMLMDWLPGRTVFEEIKISPESVDKFGFAFGETQAIIHSIHMEQPRISNWLTAGNKEEEKLIESIDNKYPQANTLIHLDYHPLNVMTDGEKITGVIDWMNASVGNYQYDIARTMAVLKIDGEKLIEPQVLELFIEAWINGYESAGQPVGDLSLFYSWAKVRMIRDAKERT